MSTHVIKRPIRILVINPNSSGNMTHGMEDGINKMNLPNSLEITTYTAPSESPASINDGTDIEASTKAVWADLEKTQLLEGNYDAVLIACYSVHSLVGKIESLYPHIPVTGIFEASICASLALAGSTSWGIVTTGKFWEDHLIAGVKDYLGQMPSDSNRKFAGVKSTGLDAGDFHGNIPADVIQGKLKEATKKLLHTGFVKCIVMGCAGMAGLEDIIRAAAVSRYGETAAKSICIVDGVQAGIGVLEQMVRNKRMFTKT